VAIEINTVATKSNNGGPGSSSSRIGSERKRTSVVRRVFVRKSGDSWSTCVSTHETMPSIKIDCTVFCRRRVTVLFFNVRRLLPNLSARMVNFIADFDVDNKSMIHYWEVYE
jgi:hypothetical protein